MTALGDRTAAELAEMLDSMERYPHNTGSLSMLDEATLAFGWKYASVGPAQRGFSESRHAHMQSWDTGRQAYSEEAWSKVMWDAHTLAAALRPLGELRIARCERETGWGTCDLALDDDGTCHGRDHTDTTTAAAP